jgi:hypothetical protein
MIMERLRDYPRSDTALGGLYDDTRRQTWDALVPLLPDETIIPRDILTVGKVRYEITGVQGVSASFFGQLVTLQRIR